MAYTLTHLKEVLGEPDRVVKQLPPGVRRDGMIYHDLSATPLEDDPSFIWPCGGLLDDLMTTEFSCMAHEVAPDSWQMEQICTRHEGALKRG